MLKGYKTYITAVVAIVGAIGAWLMGEMAIVDMFQLIVPAVVGMFVRVGIANQ
jgi:hypothetical protein|tara:strand:- start:257 stop:415 length:159 start_codon:yes stop_codon:yes gene_type:complete